MLPVMERRNTQRYNLPLAEGMELLHPELAVLNFGPSKTIDIGQLCYTQRKMPTGFRSWGRLVVVESLCRARVEHIRRLISHISSVVAHCGLRPETLHSRFTRLIVFFNWADVNGWPNVLSGEPAAVRPAFRAYAAFVRDRVARNDLGLNAGAIQQLQVAEALGDFLEIEDFGRGLNLLKKDANTANVTVPPCESAQGRVLALCEAFYKGLCELILDKAAYPFAMNMPAYLGFPMDRLWVFPGQSWFKTPAMLAKSERSAGYHFAEGRLLTAEELQIEYPVGKTKHRWSDVRRDARKFILEGNADFNHPSRWRRASQALNVYVILFLAATGMNWAQVINLSWSEDFEIDPKKQGFRTVKWRAQGKMVSFELPVASLPAFKRFLNLRRFLLQGRTCDYMFFTSETSAAPVQPIRTSLYRTYDLLQRVDPNLSKIMPREWRAAKSDWLVRNTDPSTTALVLQNSEKTVLQSYAEGSETLHHEELGSFLGQMASAVIARGQIVEGGTPRSVGVCASFGVPNPVAVNAIPIAPDCRGPEGCLFCDKLRVHADERDTRKLLSCRYCINLTAPAYGSFESFQQVLQPVLERIDKILKEVANRDPEMVRRVTREVEEEGELDPYWASKAEMLMSLGA